MTPSEYEALIADRFVADGYDVEDRPMTNDWGIDVIAVKGAERVAIQVKRYGGSTRPVNRAQVMELCGAAAYFDCTRAIVATDGRVMPDAMAVATKLGIDILNVPAQPIAMAVGRDAAHTPSKFDQLWERYIMPLAGTTLTWADGTSNTIVAVTWAGLERVTSNGRRQLIKIEIFRLAVQRVLAEGAISRTEINAMYPGRASSGVVLILSQIPGFEYEAGELRRRT